MVSPEAFPRLPGCRATTPMALAACMFTYRGGSMATRTKKFPGVDTTSKWAAVSVCLQLGTFSGVCARYQGYGKQLKDHIHEEFGANVGFAGRGEMIPNKDQLLRDRPRTRRSVGNTRAAVPFPMERQRDPTRCLPHAPNVRFHDRNRRRPWCPARCLIVKRAGYFPPAASSFTKRARCAWAPIRQSSALNKYSQAHDVKNLFVCDAAPLFVSQPDKNVTLSIVALRGRSSEYLAEEMRRGNLSTPWIFRACEHAGPDRSGHRFGCRKRYRAICSAAHAKCRELCAQGAHRA